MVKTFKSFQSNLINESEDSMHTLVNGMSTAHFGGMHNLPQSLPQNLLQNLPHLPNALSSAFHSPQFLTNNIQPVQDNQIDSTVPPWLLSLSESPLPAGSNPQTSASNGLSVGSPNLIGSQLTFPSSWLVESTHEQSNTASGGSPSDSSPSGGSQFGSSPPGGSTSSATGQTYIKLPPNIIPLGFNPSSSNLDPESGDGQIIIGTSNITSPYFYNVTSGLSPKLLPVSVISFQVNYFQFIQIRHFHFSSIRLPVSHREVSTHSD